MPWDTEVAGDVSSDGKCLVDTAVVQDPGAAIDMQTSQQGDSFSLRTPDGYASPLGPATTSAAEDVDISLLAELGDAITWGASGVSQAVPASAGTSIVSSPGYLAHGASTTWMVADQAGTHSTM